MKAIIYIVGLLMTVVAIWFDTQSICRAFEGLGIGLMVLAVVSKDSSTNS